jgi:hypothetical protein
MKTVTKWLIGTGVAFILGLCLPSRAPASEPGGACPNYCGGGVEKGTNTRPDGCRERLCSTVWLAGCGDSTNRQWPPDVPDGCVPV